MIRSGLVSGLVAGLALLPLAAHAQTDKDKDKGKTPAGDGKGDGSAGSEVELDEDNPPPDSGDKGDEENPDAPKLGAETDHGPKAPKAKKTGYPLAEVERPLTLPDFTSEVRLTATVFPKDFDGEFALRARYGITRQAQVGVQYAIGGFFDDPYGDMATTKIKFNTGKAVGVDFQYLVTNWVAPRLAIPMYVDPFAIGMVLGAPMKFHIGSKLALVGFEDVVGFKLDNNEREFVPDLERERDNAVLAQSTVDGAITPRGFLRFDFGAIYQAAPNLALSGRFGQTFNDFRDSDAATSLRAQAQFSPRRKLDLLGLIGFDRLDESRSFHLSVAAQVRI